VTIVRARYWNTALGARRYLRTFTPSTTHPARRLWSTDGVSRSAAAAAALIDRAASPRLFYGLALSPDPAREDPERKLDLQELTSQSMRSLMRRVGCALPWVAAEDHEHGRFRHVHVLLVCPRRLRPDDLAALTRVATQAALEQPQARTIVKDPSGRVSPRQQLLLEPGADRPAIERTRELMPGKRGRA
jgi:hypothetical protein